MLEAGQVADEEADVSGVDVGADAPVGLARVEQQGQRDLGDLSIETYGDLLREAITDLLDPRADVSRANRADGR